MEGFHQVIQKTVVYFLTEGVSRLKLETQTKDKEGVELEIPPQLVPSSIG